MAGSLSHHQRQEQQQRPTQEEEGEEQQQRLCENCGESRALMYCKADSAKLCFSCDRQVHSANPLFSKHTRSLLCDACDSNPASFRCSTENLVLCQSCDWVTHGRPLASLHDRRQVEGFSGCPSAIELSSILGFENLGEKSLCSLEVVGDDGYLVGSELCWSLGVADHGFSDMLVTETPPILSLDDLIVSSDSNRNFQAIGIPPLPKNRNAACGKHKEEMLRQLRELLMLEPNLSDDHQNVEPLLRFPTLVSERIPQPGNIGSGFEHDPEAIVVPKSEASLLLWHGNSDGAVDQVPLSLGSFVDESSPVLYRVTDFGSNGGHDNGGHKGQSENQSVTENLHSLPKAAQLTSHDRDSALTRYKEKKKARRYGKHVRYESRKNRAESRTRIRGRFAKISWTK